MLRERPLQLLAGRFPATALQSSACLRAFGAGEIYLDGNAPDTFRLSFEGSADSFLLVRAQRAVTQLESANFETAHSR